MVAPLSTVLRTAPSILAVVNFFALVCVSNVAAAPDVLTVEQAEVLAVETDPKERSLLEQAVEFDEVAISESQLPDPNIRVGLMNYPIEDGGFRTEGMTHLQVGVRQTFTPGRQRESISRRFHHLASSVRSTAESRRLEVVRLVRQAWLDVYYEVEASILVLESRQLMLRLIEITRSTYAVGGQNREDVLFAELELSRIDERLIEIERRQGEAIARLHRWIGPQAETALPRTLPKWETVPSLAKLQSDLPSHPYLRALDERIGASRAEVDQANSLYRPAWSVDVSYAYRDGGLPNGMPRSDFLSAAVSMNVPIFAAKRQDRRVAAAASKHQVQVHEKSVFYRQLDSELRSAFVRWHFLSEKLSHLDEKTKGKSKEYSAAVLASYQNEVGNFAEVVRSHMLHLDILLESLRLRVERHKTWAEIDWFKGADS